MCASVLLLGCEHIPKATELAHAPPPPPPAVIIPAAPPEVMEDWVSEESDLAVVRRAAQQARVRPSRRCFRPSEATCRYPWTPHALYVIPMAVDTDTAFLLAPGERLIYFSTADTHLWMADETYSGDGPTRQTVQIVKPTKAGIRTTATLATNLGLYRFELIANRRTYLPAVAWKHPPKQERLLERGEPSTARYQQRIYSDQTPSWLPLRVWDTGVHGKTYMEFPDLMTVTEAPVIYAYIHGKIHRVNHRLVDGLKTRYELDRLAPAWELRDGPMEDPQARVVRIERMHAIMP